MQHVVISEDWSPKIGGAHQWLEALYGRWGERVDVFTATACASAGVQGRAVAVGYGDDQAGDLRVRRVLHAVPSIGLDPRSWLPILRNSARIRSHVDVKGVALHCKAHFPEGLVGAFVRGFGGRQRARLVVYAHGEEVLIARSSRLLQTIATRVYTSADLVIANSENTASFIRDIAPTAAISVIHPGVDTHALAVTPDEKRRIRARLGWPEESPVVVTIGRLEPRKNVARTLCALDRLRREGADVRYVVVGTGECRSELERLIVSLNAEEWVSLAGAVDERGKREILKAADLFAMPSVRTGNVFEGFGMVFLEAAAAGLPCIAGNDGGQPEAVLDGRTGLVVDGASTDAIADGLRRLLGDEAARARMSANAVTWAASNDWQRVAEATRLAVHGAFDHE
jgi:phosphatidylinositol alpha-1,6-mannosyltransferase